MAELLRDNMELGRRGEEGPKPSRRAVPDLLSWMSMCAGIVAENQPERVKELWAYQTLVVREARRCGGRGWQAYDAMFRQQAANNPRVVWSQLVVCHLIPGQPEPAGANVSTQTDHASQNCALSPPSTGRNLGDTRPRYSDRGHSDRRRRDPASCVKMACFDWNNDRCSSPYRK